MNAIAKYAPPFLANLELLFDQGKVRDSFRLPDFPRFMLVVATDRISTHNKVHESLIIDKGAILLALSLFWKGLLEQNIGIKTHIVAWGPEIFKYLPGKPRDYPADLVYRAAVVEILDMALIEFIFRARMGGSLWSKFYSKDLPNPYGIDLPKGLQMMSPFDKPIFTPTDKSEDDVELNSKDTENCYENEVFFVRNIYRWAREYALARGIDIIDCKKEVGRDPTRRIVLADEWLTPDCCRFVEADSIVIGQEPNWLDKQFVRNEVERLCPDGNVISLRLSDETCAETTYRYHGIVELLTGKSLSALQRDLGITS